MDDRNAQVGWTEAQWNRVREEVLEAWQRVRVAGSFLPIYGPLPPSTTVVPSEVLKPDGSVDDRATADLVEIALPVTLSRQQIWEEDLSSALLQFRRRATQLGQLEDWFIFNGTYPSIGPSPECSRCVCEGGEGRASALPPRSCPSGMPQVDLSGTPRPIAGVTQDLQVGGHASAESRVVGVDRESWGVLRTVRAGRSGKRAGAGGRASREQQATQRAGKPSSTCKPGPSSEGVEQIRPR